MAQESRPASCLNLFVVVSFYNVTIAMQFMQKCYSLKSVHIFIINVRMGMQYQARERILDGWKIEVIMTTLQI